MQEPFFVGEALASDWPLPQMACGMQMASNALFRVWYMPALQLLHAPLVVLLAPFKNVPSSHFGCRLHRSWRWPSFSR